ncbi:hypothetical protein BC939DRAFT_444751 [Gamsiella multidivaricata]|uniref:uncharacterized protein n=1 Tax=Gamsiella multidivaricata TaxID=101098 RepID=UPI0022209EA8|nr:uncharacterized protein BC939DRAFT_444751 [Gamsiella multidivaricata]KAG0353761.1 hypothetical protein BGZ54_002061 [Gamsiella multidivaricata]KAI7827607.1 hypothetical protein BC939DRAFT_444751 [Gamsiella multidivaricata]
MFAAHTAPTASSATASAAGSWMDNTHLLADHHHHHHQDVLDYTSFSDDSHSPVLSLQSFSSQHSPDLDAFTLHDFEPSSSMVSASPSLIFPSQDSSNENQPSVSETARQAALLHAYLTAQDQAYRAQVQIQHQLQIQQLQQHQAQVLERTKKTDAENLARYLAQIQEVKEESSSDECARPQQNMEQDHDITVEGVRCPSSPSSTSSVMAERSPSPEASSPAKTSNNAKASSRQLVCFNCNVTQTPLWRRTPDRKHSLCNACGLYYKQYGAHRPLNVRHKLPSVLVDPRLSAMPYSRPSSETRASSPSGPESSASSESDSEEPRLLPDLTKMYADALLRPSVKKTTPPLMTAKQGIECANCSQTQTPLWRKNEAGEPICNACGLYAKLHNRARPVTMRKSKITRRRRDWGGNLAHQAKAQAQALALFHAQVQAQVEAQVRRGSTSSVEKMQQDTVSVSAESMTEEMSRRAQELSGSSALQAQSLMAVNSSDSEEEPQPQQQQQTIAQRLSGNLIMDENKFSDILGHMSAHQMNRFLSILESRCGVLRNRILANTEGSAQDSSLGNLF